MSLVIGEVFGMDRVVCALAGSLQHRHLMAVVTGCAWRHSAIRYDEWMEREENTKLCALYTLPGLKEGNALQNRAFQMIGDLRCFRVSEL